MPKITLFNVTSVIQALYALIGLVIVIVYPFEEVNQTIVALVLYCGMPMVGAYGAWKQRSLYLALALFFFIFQSVRSANAEGVLLNIAPISISVPFGDFANGQGMYIDFFAIGLALLLIILMRKLAYKQLKKR